MKKRVFEGIATALVTPFNDYGIDYASMHAIIERQIENGVSAIVVAATTGEAPTLTDREHKTLIEFCVKTADKRVVVIAGTGSNDTSHAVMMTKFAESVGADGALVVTPYYNRATQNGLLEHFNAISESVDLPIIIYNVPDRTGVDISVETYQKLVSLRNVCGVKEASSNMIKNATVLAKVGGQCEFYAGNDQLLLPFLSLGAGGAVSVLSNVFPKQVCEIFSAFKSGKIERAREIYMDFSYFADLLFKETNPIPVKYALSELNLIKNRLRLPLTDCSKDLKTLIKEELNRLISGEKSGYKSING